MTRLVFCVIISLTEIRIEARASKVAAIAKRRGNGGQRQKGRPPKRAFAARFLGARTISALLSWTVRQDRQTECYQIFGISNAQCAALPFDGRINSAVFYFSETMKGKKEKMEKKTVFTGAATAIITPMTADGVDYESFGRLIDWQISEGIDAIVVGGTTGEASTLTDDEHREIIRFAVERASGRTPIIAGTGSNDTAYAIELTRFAKEVGADAALVVTPYYNKATQKGLIKMYETIADAGELPIILYNVPSRTGVNIDPKTIAALAEHPYIVGLKEANGDISKAVETMALVGDKLDLYSGNDDQIVPLLSIGGKGVISVLSNLLPAETSRMCKLFFDGKVKEAASEQFRLLALTKALFSEVNPIPVKAAMQAMGYCSEDIRMPLTPMEDAHKTVLLAEMKKAGVKF